MSQGDAAPRLEIAHVLYMDLVGYSRLPIEEQPRQLAELQELVRAAPEFRRAEAGGDLLCRPTGDGLALVFFRDPVAPVQCALQIARAARGSAHLSLRMGLHSGPVYRIADINASADVSGSGINLAQRVMDCGDDGHILLSSVMRELVGQVGAWPVQDLGECEVKHGQRLHLFNLFTDEVGNPALPSRFQPSAPSVAAIPARPPLPSLATPAAALRVALLYKRNAQPDEAVLTLLEKKLSAQGFSVFVDRHLKIGVEWAAEIERQLQGADAVVPLLSAASVESEMLQCEVQIAHEAAEKRQGKPRILPVRLNHRDPLPEGLAVYLDRLEYALWEGPHDDARIAAAIIDALRAPPEPRSAPTRVRLEPVGGAVALDSELYVERATDEQFRGAITRGDSIVLVKGARQMGKTSLLARGLEQARQAGATVIQTDFQMLNTEHLASTDALFRILADAIADQLDLDTLPADSWDSQRGPNINLQRYLRRAVLGSLDTPVVWGLDEVDRIFVCPFAGEVFGLFRSWHNARSLDPSGPWSRLTLAIAYATEHHLFITDVNQSPFNVGTHVTLEDFALEQVADLNHRHGKPLRDDAEVARFYRLVSGQPFLVRRGLLEMATHGISIGAIEAQADRDEGIFGDHLRRFLVLLVRNAELCDVVRGILHGRPCPTPESFYHLRSAGILAGDGPQSARPRCQLYATYLARHLL
jgi:class 3 adenylate cyclase